MSQSIVIIPPNYKNICATILSAQEIIDDTLTENFMISFPNTAPNVPNTVLLNDGSGNLSWVDISILINNMISAKLEQGIWSKDGFEVMSVSSPAIESQTKSQRAKSKKKN